MDERFMDTPTGFINKNKYAILRKLLVLLNIVLVLILNDSSLELLKSVIVLPLFILLPIESGMILSYVLKIQVRDYFSAKYLDWLLGSFMLLILSALLNMFGLFNLNLLTLIYGLVSVIIVPRTHVVFPYKTRHLFFLFTIVILIGLASFLFYRYNSPFPYQLGWDIFTHHHIINKIHNHIFYLDLRDYSSSFIMNGYSPIYHLLIALFTNLAGIEIISFYWSINLIIFPVFSLGIYLLSNQLFNNRFISLLSSLFSLFFIENGPVTNHLHFIPSTILLISIVYSLYTINNTSGFRSFHKIRIILLILTGFLLFHYLIGPIIILIFLFFLLFTNIKALNRIIRPLIFLVILLLVIELSLIPHLNLKINFLPTEESWFYFHSMDSKISRLYEWFSPTILLLSVFGAIIYLLSGNRPDIMLLILINLITFAVFLVPISSIIRVAIIFHPFIAIFSSFAIERIGSMFQDLGRKIFLMLIIVISIISLINCNYLFFNKIGSYGDINDKLSSFTVFEHNMALWVRSNTPKDSLIISEPSTQNIISALSNRETLRGPYPNKTEEDLIFLSFTTNSSSTSHQSLCMLSKTNNTYVVINGRVKKWFEKVNKVDITWSVWMPQKFSQFPSFDNFFDDSKFELMHEIDHQIYLFKINDCENYRK